MSGRDEGGVSGGWGLSLWGGYPGEEGQGGRGREEGRTSIHAHMPPPIENR
jgi:hypothetical protein